MAQPTPIQEAEQALHDLDHAPGPLDGMNDDQLPDAIRAWRAASGLPVAGGMSVTDLEMLLARAARARPATAPAAMSPPVTSGPVVTRTKDLNGVRQHRLGPCAAVGGSGLMRYRGPGPK